MLTFSFCTYTNSQHAQCPQPTSSKAILPSQQSLGTSLWKTKSVHTSSKNTEDYALPITWINFHRLLDMTQYFKVQLIATPQPSFHDPSSRNSWNRMGLPHADNEEQVWSLLLHGTRSIWQIPEEHFSPWCVNKIKKEDVSWHALAWIVTAKYSLPAQGR